MAILGVDQFKAKLAGGGARPNLFKITLAYPKIMTGDVELTSFMCNAGNLPASTINPVTVPYRGRMLYMAGDRTFEPWSVTIINDVKMETRNAFERWMNGINQHNANTGLVNPVDYQADMIIEQLDKAGETVKRYDFRGTFPTNISAIDVSYDSENVIEEFTVELQVQYWESETTT